MSRPAESSRNMSAQLDVCHGVQYIPRNQQASMFELLSWRQNGKSQLPRAQEGRFTDPHKYMTSEKEPKTVKAVETSK